VNYWGTILFSQTLGTALGDWMADTNRLGYEGGALVFGTGLALVAAAYFFTSVSRTVLFWAAFILTRPLGATLGDLLDKPVDHGGSPSCGAKETVIVRRLAQRELRLKLARFADNPEELAFSYKRESLRDMCREAVFGAQATNELFREAS
jgi:hypothetical protein